MQFDELKVLEFQLKLLGSPLLKSMKVASETSIVSKKYCILDGRVNYKAKLVYVMATRAVLRPGNKVITTLYGTLFAAQGDTRQLLRNSCRCAKLLTSLPVYNAIYKNTRQRYSAFRQRGAYMYVV